MSAGVIVGLEHHLEADLVTAVEASRDLVVVRRCADCAELLSTAAAGVGDIAVVSPGFRGVDREAAEALFDRLRFGPLTRARLRQLAP